MQKWKTYSLILYIESHAGLEGFRPDGKYCGKIQVNTALGKTP